jgi:hypothetical protein
MHRGLWSENLIKQGDLEDLVLGGKILLKLILKEWNRTT